LDHKKIILGRLLDKYEKSKSFQDESSKRRVMLKMAKGDVPEYDIEKPVVRETFNSVIQELSEKGMIGFDWVKFEKGNIVDKVWLIIPNVDYSYAEIGRKSKRVVLEAILKQVDLLEAKISTDWIIRYLEEIRQSIEERASTAGLLPDDEEQALALLKALELIDGLDGRQCLERVFSLRCFNDSKYFERKIKSRIVGIVKKYHLGQEIMQESLEEMSDDDILMHVGIIQSPEQIDFKGGILGRIGKKTIDFSPFIHGISINVDTVKDLVIENMGNVCKILFIENKANYNHFIAMNNDSTMMVVFHGGFYSPAKGIFLKKLYEAAAPRGIEFYHWGDIDLGGFMIFKRLKNNIIPTLKPYLMDKEAIISKIDYAVPFDENYAGKLRMLLEDEQYSEFRDVIEFMLEKNVRLEQEAFLV